MAPRDIRVALIGDEGVGKSSIISALIKSVSTHGAQGTGLYSSTALSLACPRMPRVRPNPKRNGLTAASSPSPHLAHPIRGSLLPPARPQRSVCPPRTENCLARSDHPTERHSRPRRHHRHHRHFACVSPSFASREPSHPLIMQALRPPQLDQKTRVTSSTRSGKPTSSPSSVSLTAPLLVVRPWPSLSSKDQDLPHAANEIDSAPSPVDSVDNPNSFDRVPTYWLPTIRSLGVNVPVILIGNKIDLREGQVTNQALEDGEYQLSSLCCPRQWFLIAPRTHRNRPDHARV